MCSSKEGWDSPLSSPPMPWPLLTPMAYPPTHLDIRYPYGPPTDLDIRYLTPSWPACHYIRQPAPDPTPTRPTYLDIHFVLEARHQTSTPGWVHITVDADVLHLRGEGGGGGACHHRCGCTAPMGGGGRGGCTSPSMRAYSAHRWGGGRGRGGWGRGMRGGMYFTIVDNMHVLHHSGQSVRSLALVAPSHAHNKVLSVWLGD